MPALIDLSPLEAIDDRVQATVRECFSEFGAVHLDPASESMQVHIPNHLLHQSIHQHGVLGTWDRMRRGYESLAEALHGETALRLRLIRAADMHVEDERRL